MGDCLTLKDVIILLKLSGFFFTGYLISVGLVLWTGGLIILNVEEVATWTYNLAPNVFGFTSLALIEGAFTILVLSFVFGFWLIWEVMDLILLRKKI